MKKNKKARVLSHEESLALHQQLATRDAGAGVSTSKPGTTDIARPEVSSGEAHVTNRPEATEGRTATAEAKVHHRGAVTDEAIARAAVAENAKAEGASLPEDAKTPAGSTNAVQAKTLDERGSIGGGGRSPATRLAGGGHDRRPSDSYGQINGNGGSPGGSD